MNELILILILIGLMAFVCEYIDCSFGMGYGTILSPILLIMGYETYAVVPAILFSQAIGGFSASMFHHKNGNVKFGLKTRDSLIVYIIAISGVAATVFAVFVAVTVSQTIVKTYIGTLILIIGLIMLSGYSFAFRFRKMIYVGLISAFNKGISGGGFGPLVTGGQIVSGQGHKSAIGITTMAEAPICIAGFIAYYFMKGIPDWKLLAVLSIGAILSTPFGAITTKKLDDRYLKKILGIFVTVLGAWALLKALT